MSFFFVMRDGMNESWVREHTAIATKKRHVGSMQKLAESDLFLILGKLNHIHKHTKCHWKLQYMATIIIKPIELSFESKVKWRKGEIIADRAEWFGGGG